MTNLSRRNFVVSAGAATAAFGLAGPMEFLTPAFAQKAPAGSDPATMGFKKFKVGDVEVTTIYDGIWEKAHDSAFIKNASIDDTKKALVAAKLSDPQLQRTVNCVVAKIRGGDGTLD